MTHREQWEEVSFQVIDDNGVMRSGYFPTGEGIVTGNVQVDRVWGNFPMQPDDDRSYDEFSFGGGSGDNGWNSAWSYNSDTLQTGTYDDNSAVRWLFDIKPDTGSDHINAAIGWSNFPAYIPNYAGDEDSGLETVIPDVLRKTIGQAEYILDQANLNWRINYHNPAVQYLESTGTTVRVYAYDTNAGGGGGGGAQEAFLVGLKVGDKVWVDNNQYDFGMAPVTITKVNEDGTDSWIEFEVETAPNLDTGASGTIWPGPDLQNVITVMRFWNQPGNIVNEGTRIYLRALGD
jgi:hypothetical protein